LTIPVETELELKVLGELISFRIVDVFVNVLEWFLTSLELLQVRESSSTVLPKSGFRMTSYI